METDALKELKEQVSQGCLTRIWLLFVIWRSTSCLDSPPRTAKFGIECIADEKLLSKMLFIWCLSISRM